MRIDLHSHSTASDGTEPPAEVVRRARQAGLDVLALTDHDTVAGLAEAEAALPDGLTLVAGMEMSCARDGLSIHLLAYLFDPADPELSTECARGRESRDSRGRLTVERLNALGVPITWEQVTALAGDAPVGRPHIARAMVAAGVIDDPAQAFTEEWIGGGGRAFVRRYAPDPVTAVRMVRAAGGVPVLAHPKAAQRGRTVSDALIAELAGAGLFGVEIDHADHDDAARAHLRGLAAELGLAATGSSDDHGDLTGHRLGAHTTDPEVYERMVAQATGATPVRRV
ncbi:PHP domain-containing protein [Thermomonospora cellulosilytica]|uniref:Putative metal-dependent phosphoesterase TrpH n=1 Tax=Thermomonospora cellulosilytica TaxID=1411118 RepID=A0A7W3R922_9ACTN|nr:PHP domain-containing protein [Thermomonospora cellulosilytica]MBA9003915.1 putative metal-dependent phosphoesterase TrpH [Thermomonospora cellulosilytica]